jgi:hypothetical protein
MARFRLAFPTDRHAFGVGTLAALLSTALVMANPATAQPAPPLGFVTIGAPGNRATIPSEVPSNPGLEIGAVAYEFRLTRTEATVEQYAQFANAYLRWNPQRALDNEVLSTLAPTGDGRVQFLPENAQLPVTLSWRTAARWCNWLHDDQADRADAFENGAYDTSTFVTMPGGVVLDQLTRSPGARFWIPSRDEWTKGAYYDPHRYGQDVGGYWRQPNSTNIPLESGLPSAGGETNAGLGLPPGVLDMPVGSRIPRPKAPGACSISRAAHGSDRSGHRSFSRALESSWGRRFAMRFILCTITSARASAVSGRPTNLPPVCESRLRCLRLASRVSSCSSVHDRCREREPSLAQRVPRHRDLGANRP